MNDENMAVWLFYSLICIAMVTVFGGIVIRGRLKNRQQTNSEPALEEPVKKRGHPSGWEMSTDKVIERYEKLPTTVRRWGGLLLAYGTIRVFESIIFMINNSVMFYIPSHILIVIVGLIAFFYQEPVMYGLIAFSNLLLSILFWSSAGWEVTFNNVFTVLLFFALLSMIGTSRRIEEQYKQLPEEEQTIPEHEYTAHTIFPLLAILGAAVIISLWIINFVIHEIIGFRSLSALVSGATNILMMLIFSISISSLIARFLRKGLTIPAAIVSGVGLADWFITIGLQRLGMF